MNSVTRVDICPIPEPGRIEAFEAELDSGRIDVRAIVGIVGKVDGTGTFNDMGRALTAQSLRAAIDRRLGSAPAARAIPIVLSSGCAGLISPHITVFSRQAAGLRSEAPTSSRLTVGRAMSEPIAPLEIGRVAHVEKIAAAVREARADAGPLDTVDAVLVKSPSLKPEHFREYPSRLCCAQVTESLGWATDTAALGVAMALDELGGREVRQADIRSDWSLYSDVALISAGPEIDCAEVVLIGNSWDSSSDLRSGHALIRDPLDRQGVIDAIVDAQPEATKDFDASAVVQVFAKLILPVDDIVRQHPVSFAQEPSPALGAKAIGAALIGSTIGHSRVFVSGGERGSHQGAPGGGPVAAIVAVKGQTASPGFRDIDVTDREMR